MNTKTNRVFTTSKPELSEGDSNELATTSNTTLETALMDVGKTPTAQKVEINYHAVPLTQEDLEFRDEQESRVEGSFLQACEALLKIEKYREGRIWKPYESFPNYVNARFGYSGRYCALMVRAAAFNQAVKSIGDGIPSLSRESHVRPIVQLIREDEDRTQFWTQFCNDKALTPQSVLSLTAKEIREAVLEYKSKSQDGEEDNEAKSKKEADKVKKARRESKKLVTALKKAVASLPDHEVIHQKLEEIHKLLKESN
jgi:hypothetical protein